MQYLSLVAGEQALEKSVAVQREAVAAAEANLARLEKMQGYRSIKAPFDGVVTMRNVDVGALVNAGTTLLFRIAQISTLRTYVNVPQTHASAIRNGQVAEVSVSNLPGRTFTGSVAPTPSPLASPTPTLLPQLPPP